VKRGLLLMGLASVVGVVALSAATLCLTSGCSTVGYYAQSLNGHIALLNRARPVAEVVADPATPAPLRERLRLTERMRDYAVKELHLPDNASYRRFADLQRPAAVWNVVAAPELSLTLKTWCFAVVGCVGYRGYFERAPAEALATELRAEGLEVNVNAIPAYSTLGKLPGAYFSDPLLSTFIQMQEGDLARLIFHELAHQVAYAQGDTVFNESFATSVERIGGQRWLAEHSSDAVRADYDRLEGRRQTFREMTMKARNDLDAIFHSALGDDEKRAAKAVRMAQLRADYAALRAGPWLGFSGYDGWFARANNASLGVLAAYNQLVPQFELLFDREGRDFDRFYAEVKRLAALSKDERRAALDTLQQPAP
jgi:predicted aminopeptidase